MTTKTLIGIAVASTFGWTAASHASNHQTTWVSAGEEQYPPMVMFEGRTSDTFAAAPAPGPENIGGTSRDIVSVSSSEPSRTTRQRMRRSTPSSSIFEREWVASGEERYPAMVMFEAPSILASASPDVIANTPPDTLTNTSPDTLASAPRVTPENTSSEPGARTGATIGTPPDSVGASTPIEPPADPNRTTGTDMHSGKEDKSAATNAEGPDVAANGVYTEVYVVSWTPMTSADWEAFLLSRELQGETSVSLIDGNKAPTPSDVTVLPSDILSVPQVTADPQPANEGTPG